MKIFAISLLVSAAFVLLSGCDRLPDVITDLLPGGSDAEDVVAVVGIIEEQADDTEDVAPYDYDAYYYGGINGAGGDFLPIIEVYEDRILFGGNDITLADLEEILMEHGDFDFTWEVRDVHQAVQVVYSAVIDILNGHGVRFIEN